MPVVTSFLRNSLVIHPTCAAVPAKVPPKAQGRRGREDAKRSAAGQPDLLSPEVTARDRISSTWSAAYAYPVEVRYRYAMGASEQWDGFVARNVARLQDG